MQTDILSQSGPYALSFDATTRVGIVIVQLVKDTIYVWTTCGGTGYAGGVDILYRRNKSYDTSALSGVFYARPTSPSLMASYSKLVLSKQRRFSVKAINQEHLLPIKKGVKASIDFVNDQIGVWTSEDGKLESCPSFTHIEQADIDNFLNNALGNSSDITLGKF